MNTPTVTAGLDVEPPSGMNAGLNVILEIEIGGCIVDSRKETYTFQVVRLSKHKSQKWLYRV